MHRILVALALVSCSTAPPGPDARAAALTATDAEARHWATQAALLDPRCWHLAWSSGSTLPLDVTVPEGRTWYASNAYAATYNRDTAIAASQDDYPLARRAGAIRTLDARRTLALPAGTRVTSAPGIHEAYVWYADPVECWAADPRYADDARGLYYDRLARLETLPLLQVSSEATGGGSIDDVVRAPLPPGPLVLLHVAVQDAAWGTVSTGEDGAPPLNTIMELDNTRPVRFDAVILQPLPDLGPPRWLVGKKCAYDGNQDPAVAMPIKHAVDVELVQLPEGW